MSDDAAVLWMDGGGADEQAARALDEWARARGVRLTALEPARASDASDPSSSELVEKELDHAREAIGASDAGAAERALSRAETTLREHPEFPHAAWLRAEVERTWSARWLRVEPRDEARGRDAWATAEALDGGRVAGIGEAIAPPRPRVKVAIVVTAEPRARVVVRLDGAPLTASPRGPDEPDSVYETDVAPAEHHLVVVADGRVRSASWLTVPRGGAAEPFRVQATRPGGGCSADQFSDVKREPGTEGRELRAAGVMCPRWIAAAVLPGAPRGVLVARCEYESCGPLVEWRAGLDAAVRTGAPPAHGGDRATPSRSSWPAWATWTLVGVGALTATSVALLAAGVFDARPVEPRFVVGGARQE